MIDEHTLAEALQSLDGATAPDLLTKVRRGGRRRLLRHRSYAAAGVAAVAGAAAPITTAVLHQHGATALGLGRGHRAHGAGDLYAPPPPAGSQCNGGVSGNSHPDGHAAASAYPQLLYLPPGQPVRYAFVRSQRGTCAPPHVALTAWQRAGGEVVRGLVVEGPNAPSAMQAGYAGPDVGFSGQNGHQQIDRQAGREFTIRQAENTEAFWTEPDGGQWHATVKGVSQDRAVQLLDRLRLDPRSGTAALSGPVAHAWQVEPPAQDQPRASGWFTSEWTDAQGHRVDLDATQTPDRMNQLAAADAGTRTVITVRGHRALYSPVDGLGGGVPVVTWQEAPDVQIDLTVVGGTEQEVVRVADSLGHIAANDPRINRN
jgi:hypothetical protein